jgi:hypothetical protein
VPAVRAGAPFARGLAVRGKGAFGACLWDRFLWSLTADEVGVRTISHISLRCGATEFPSQPHLFAVELAESGEVQIVADLELASAEQEESGDQMRVAADDAELAAKLLFPAGHGTLTPSPLPVREAAV